MTQIFPETTLFYEMVIPSSVKLDPLAYGYVELAKKAEALSLIVRAVDVHDSGEEALFQLMKTKGFTEDSLIEILTALNYGVKPVNKGVLMVTTVEKIEGVNSGAIHLMVINTDLITS